MDLLAFIEKLTTFDPDAITDTLTDRELFDLSAQTEEAIQQLHAKAMVPQAAAAKRHAYRSRQYRSNATAHAHQTRLSRIHCANNINQADTLVHHLSDIYSYYEVGLMNRSQIDLICRLFHDRVLRPFVIQDQHFFIDHAHEPWPVFRTLVMAWAQATKDREDDDDPDERAQKNRKLVWGQGLDREILGEFHMPNHLFEQFLEIVTPFYDALRKEEVRDARAAAWQDPSLEPAEGEYFDLARTDSQRWLDALMAALRVRGSVLRNLKDQATRNGADPDADIELDLDELDAGVAAQVIIIADQETLEREKARQLGIELPPRSARSAANYRCETLSGLPVSAATALLHAEIGSFRRLLLKPDSLDFELSRKARLFSNIQRLGLIARDRHCQGRGCDTPGKFCQADHIIEHTRGGPTIPRNGQLLCGPCNQHKERMRTTALC